MRLLYRSIGWVWGATFSSYLKPTSAEDFGVRLHGEDHGELVEALSNHQPNGVGARLLRNQNDGEKPQTTDCIVEYINIFMERG
jgi:hypothetical protein